MFLAIRSFLITAPDNSEPLKLEANPLKHRASRTLSARKIARRLRFSSFVLSSLEDIAHLASPKSNENQETGWNPPLTGLSVLSDFCTCFLISDSGFPGIKDSRRYLPDL